MVFKLLALTAALTLAACVVDDPEAPTDSELGVAVAPPAVTDTYEASTVDMIEQAPPTLCELLPTDPDDPCSHLCDPGGVTPYLEPGTCTLLACKLTDGTIQRAGGCIP